MKSLIVTGSDGFVGTNLLRCLHGLSYNVTGIDINNGYDLSNIDCLAQIPRADILVHLAGITSVPASFIEPYKYLHINYLTTLAALEVARRDQARFIHISSYLYGSPNYLPIDENHTLAPHNPYAQSKLNAENLCVGYHRDFNVQVIILRPFNIYGPGMKDNSLIPNIFRQLKTGIIELADFDPKRDYLYIQDLCQAIIAALDAEEVDYDVFNLGYGKSYSAYDVAKIIVTLSGKDANIISAGQRRKGEVMDCYANIEKARNILGWIPRTDLHKGLSSFFSS